MHEVKGRQARLKSGRRHDTPRSPRFGAVRGQERDLSALDLLPPRPNEGTSALKVSRQKPMSLSSICRSTALCSEPRVIFAQKRLDAAGLERENLVTLADLGTGRRPIQEKLRFLIHHCLSSINCRAASHFDVQFEHLPQTLCPIRFYLSLQFQFEVWGGREFFLNLSIIKADLSRILSFFIQHFKLRINCHCGLRTWK